MVIVRISSVSSTLSEAANEPGDAIPKPSEVPEELWVLAGHLFKASDDAWCLTSNSTEAASLSSTGSGTAAGCYADWDRRQSLGSEDAVSKPRNDSRHQTLESEAAFLGSEVSHCTTSPRHQLSGLRRWHQTSQNDERSPFRLPGISSANPQSLQTQGTRIPLLHMRQPDVQRTGYFKQGEHLPVLMKKNRVLHEMLTEVRQEELAMHQASMHKASTARRSTRFPLEERSEFQPFMFGTIPTWRYNEVIDTRAKLRALSSAREFAGAIQTAGDDAVRYHAWLHHKLHVDPAVGGHSGTARPETTLDDVLASSNFASMQLRRQRSSAIAERLNHRSGSRPGTRDSVLRPSTRELAAPARATLGHLTDKCRTGATATQIGAQRSPRPRLLPELPRLRSRFHDEGKILNTLSASSATRPRKGANPVGQSWGTAATKHAIPSTQVANRDDQHMEEGLPHSTASDQYQQQAWEDRCRETSLLDQNKLLPFVHRIWRALLRIQRFWRRVLQRKRAAVRIQRAFREQNIRL